MNLFAVLPLIKARLADLPDVHTVQSIQELAQLLEQRDIQPIDNALYVGLDGYAPINQTAGNKRMKKKRLSFSVILAKQFYGAVDVPHEDIATGEMLHRICASLQGWQPETADQRPMTITPFDEVQAVEPLYYDNFALYPLRFETEILINYSKD